MDHNLDYTFLCKELIYHCIISSLHSYSAIFSLLKLYHLLHSTVIVFVGLLELEMDLLTIETLRSTNYATWSVEMRSFLKKKELSMFIDEDEPRLKSILISPKGREGNALAMRIIASKVDTESYKEVICHCKTAKEMWQALLKDQLRLFNLDIPDYDDSDSSGSYDDSLGSGKFVRQNRTNQFKKYQALPTTPCQLCHSDEHIARSCPEHTRLKSTGSCTIS